MERHKQGRNNSNKNNTEERICKAIYIYKKYIYNQTSPGHVPLPAPVKVNSILAETRTTKYFNAQEHFHLQMETSSFFLS